MKLVCDLDSLAEYTKFVSAFDDFTDEQLFCLYRFFDALCEIRGLFGGCDEENNNCYEG